MKFFFTILILITSAISYAHEVSGTVQIMMKGEKKKSDLSSVIVYLESSEGAAKISPASLKKDFSMMTKNKQLSPRTMAVPMGATVRFPNFDPIFHNLFSLSPPNSFDLGLYKGGASKSKTFESPGIVRVFCNVHPQMSASIVVANTPYYAFADADGNYSLGLIPWGTFMLRAYSEEGQATQQIQVKDTPLKVTLIIDARGFKKMPHKNKFGKDYSADDNEKY